MSDTGTLAARTQALEDLEALTRLKPRYWRCLDQKRWDDLATCFAADAPVDSGSGRYRSPRVAAVSQLLRTPGFDWRSFLLRWSREWLASGDSARDALPPGMRELSLT